MNRYILSYNYLPASIIFAEMQYVIKCLAEELHALEILHDNEVDQL